MTLNVYHKRQLTHSRQTPVIEVDQPLFAIAKSIHWKWPEEYGETKFVGMFGGLHIELIAYYILGDFLKDSGWTSALLQAGVCHNVPQLVLPMRFPESILYNL